MSPVQTQLDEVNQQLYELKQRKAELLKERPMEPVESAEFLLPLFGDKSEMLLIHHLGKGCNYCTLWADGLNGIARQLQQRAAVVIASPDSPEVQAETAKARSWTLPMVSVTREFTEALGYYVEGQGYWPGVSALHKDADGKIWRTNKDVFGPGDDYMPVWPLFDLLKDGPNGWEPS